MVPLFLKSRSLKLAILGLGKVCAVSSWWEGFTDYGRGFSADGLVNAVSVVVVMVLVEGRRVPITNIKLFKVPSVGAPWDWIWLIWFMTCTLYLFLNLLVL